MPRSAKDHIDKRWDERSVQSVDSRLFGQKGIGNALRDLHHSDSDASDQVGGEIGFPVVVGEPFEDGDQVENEVFEGITRCEWLVEASDELAGLLLELVFEVGLVVFKLLVELSLGKEFRV